MEILPENILILFFYHLLFFRKFYFNPFLQSTGEMISTFFPQLLWQGRKWLKGKTPFKDDLWYKEPCSIPFLATFYPPQFLISLLCAILPVDLAFSVFQYFVLSHYFIGSVLGYFYFSQFCDPLVSLFGAITLSYMSASIKIGEPCIVYTVCWLIGYLLGGWLGGLSLGFAILGGYWPLVLYFSPVLFLHFDWTSVSLGLLIGLPQIIPSVFYYPRSVRWKEKLNHQFGRVPFWKLKDLFFLDSEWMRINDVLSWEQSLYCGLFVPFLSVFGDIKYILVSIVSLLLSMTYAPFRCPCRFLHVFSFSLVLASVEGLEKFSYYSVGILILNSFFLLRNAEKFPWHPFAEPIKKPSEWLKEKPSEKFPFFTGYWHDKAISEKRYRGGFSLAN